MSDARTTGLSILRTAAMLGALVLGFFGTVDGSFPRVVLVGWDDYDGVRVWNLSNLVAFAVAIATCLLPGPSRFWRRSSGVVVGLWMASSFVFEGENYECVRNIVGRTYCHESDHTWTGLSPGMNAATVWVHFAATVLVLVALVGCGWSVGRQRTAGGSSTE